MIDHRPFGIDDPYKPLPVERFPRDPVAGDAVRLGFAAPGAAAAHVEVRGPAGASEHPAQPLGSGFWTAELPPLPAGAWGYTIHARDAGGARPSRPSSCRSRGCAASIGSSTSRFTPRVCGST